MGSSGANGVCSFQPGDNAADWLNCPNPTQLSGCTAHMHCLDNEFCASCELCNYFAVDGGHNGTPMCGACVKNLGGDGVTPSELTDAISSTNMNPATFNGYDWNIATAS